MNTRIAPLAICNFIFIAALIGCKFNKNIQKSPQENVHTNTHSTSLFRILGDDTLLKSTIQATSPCKINGDTLICINISGDAINFISWKYPETDSADGDGVRFEYRGELIRNKNINIMHVEFQHDAPSTVFWLKNDGRFFHIDIYSDNQVYVDSNINNMIMIHEDPLNDTPARADEFFIYKNLDSTSQKFICKNANSIKISKNSLSVLPDTSKKTIEELSTNSILSCKEDYSRDILPKYFINR